MDVRHLIMHDPQRLVDDQTRFQLESPMHVPMTCTLVDGWAAGSSWLLFRFIDGDLGGTELWCEGWDPADGFIYRANTRDQGDLFNPQDPADLDAVPGGAYRPFLDGIVFTLA